MRGGALVSSTSAPESGCRSVFPWKLGVWVGPHLLLWVRDPMSMKSAGQRVKTRPQKVPNLKRDPMVCAKTSPRLFCLRLKFDEAYFLAYGSTFLLVESYQFTQKGLSQRFLGAISPSILRGYISFMMEHIFGW